MKRRRNSYRPAWVRISYIDPLDEKLLWSVILPYTKRQSADGEYSAWLRCHDDTRKLCSRILGIRKPAVRVNLFPPRS